MLRHAIFQRPWLGARHWPEPSRGIGLRRRPAVGRCPAASRRAAPPSPLFPVGWRVTSTANKAVLEAPEADSARGAGRCRTGGRCRRRRGGGLGRLSWRCPPAAAAGDAAGAAQWLGGAAPLFLRNLAQREGRGLCAGLARRPELDGDHRRRPSGHLRKTPRGLFARDRKPAAQGICARAVRRTAQAHALDAERIARAQRTSSATPCSSSTSRVWALR